MNTNYPKTSSLRRQLCRVVSASALLLVGFAAMGQAVPKSPVGTWDCVISGSFQRGIAFLRFSSDSTFSGYQLDSPAQRSTSVPSDDGRGTGSEAGRSSSTSNTNSLSAKTNLFGFTHVQGPWSFDNRGRVIGSFIQVVDQGPSTTNWQETCMSTNVFADATYITTGFDNRYDLYTNISVCFSTPTLTTNITWNNLPPPLGYQLTFYNSNYPGSQTIATNFVVNTNISGITFTFSTYFAFNFTDVTYTATVVWTNVTASAMFSFVNTNPYTISPGPGSSTNAVSFVGTVVPGKRLTLTASAGYGKVTYNGGPMKAGLPDLSGRWYGYKTENRQQFLEFFDLVPFSRGVNPWPLEFPDITTFPNVYFTSDGRGPGFDFYGVSILSGQKKIGFAAMTSQWGAGTNSLLSATYGSFSASRRATNAVTTGTEEPLTPINFNASWQQP